MANDRGLYPATKAAVRGDPPSFQLARARHGLHPFRPAHRPVHRPAHRRLRFQAAPRIR